MPKTVTEVLTEARELIARSDRLAHHIYEENGCYCTYGAIIKVIEPRTRVGNMTHNLSYANNLCNPLVIEAVNYIAKAAGITTDIEGNIYDYNDRHEKDHMIQIFGRAIELSKEPQ